MSIDCGHIVLANGQKMPRLGLGTWLAYDTEVTAAVEHAIDIGYRHIDCAHIYLNEMDVVKRSDLFLTGKLWNAFHKPELVEEGLNYTLKHLNTDYLDLYLIHWPTATELRDSWPASPKESPDKMLPTGEIAFRHDTIAPYLATWRKLEDLLATGKIRAIGLSNFNWKQWQNIIANCRVVPHMMHLEMNPISQHPDLLNFARKHNIAVTGYAPLACGGRPPVCLGNSSYHMNNAIPTITHDRVVLEDPRLIEIGKQYGKTAAQVCVRFGIQRGYVVIPKSVKLDRITENASVFDFELSDADMDIIYSMNRNLKLVCNPHFFASPYYPLKYNSF